MENEITYRKAKIVIMALCIGILFLVSVRLYTQMGLSESSGELYILKEQIKDLQRKNLILEEQVLQKESYTNLYPAAVRVGFRPITDKDIYILK